MVNVGRRLGANIYSLMHNANISLEKLAIELGYTLKDVCRLIEGKVLLPPRELSRVAEVLGTTKDELLDYNSCELIPELQYMKEFSNPENLDKVLDLLDECVELQESL